MCRRRLTGRAARWRSDMLRIEMGWHMGAEKILDTICSGIGMVGKRAGVALLLLALFLPQVLCAEIYFWVDDDGVKHFANSRTAVENGPGTAAVSRSGEIEYDAVADQARQQEYERWRRQKAAGGRYRAASETSSDSRSDTAEDESRPPRFRVVSTGIYEVSGYKVNVTGHQRGRQLQLRGRVSYGPRCERLRIDMKLRNRDGDTISVRAHVADVGGPRSGLIREDQEIRKFESRVTDTWHVVDMYVSCAAR